MASVSVVAKFPVSADTLWQRIGRFDSLDWNPIVTKMEVAGSGVGAVRTCTLQGGNLLREQLDRYDGERHEYDYSAADGQLPVTGYRVTLRVRSDGAGSLAEWSSTFEPAGMSEAAAVELVRGVYQSALDNLKRLVS